MSSKQKGLSPAWVEFYNKKKQQDELNNIIKSMGNSKIK